MKMVVAQMYNCIRMEFRKCFHSHNFIISMATCVLLALSSASYCCQGYLNIHDALDQYCFENGHMVSNELFPVWTSYNYWIGGESETLAYSAFYTLLPLFAILPHSLSCLQEKKSSYANQMIVRVGRQPYYLSKGIVCFSAAFITIVIPLILNFAVTAAFIPSTVPQINYEIYNHIYSKDYALVNRVADRQRYEAIFAARHSVQPQERHYAQYRAVCLQPTSRYSEPNNWKACVLAPIQEAVTGTASLDEAIQTAVTNWNRERVE